MYYYHCSRRPAYEDLPALCGGPRLPARGARERRRLPRALRVRRLALGHRRARRADAPQLVRIRAGVANFRVQASGGC